MSYINVESQGVQYRVILAHHNKNTSPSQLPEGCTGIVIEGSVNIRNTMYDALVGAERLAKTPFVVQFSVLRRDAQSRGIPIIAGEPLATPEARFFTESNLFPITVIMVRLATRRLYDIASKEGVIEVDSPEFTKIKQTIHFYAEKNPKVLITPKDLLIAERSQAFAEFQSRSGIHEPRLAVVVGSMHLGTAEEIRTSQEERLTRILSNDQISRYYQQNNLGDILYVTYNTKRQLWSKQLIVDQHLRRK